MKDLLTQLSASSLDRREFLKNGSAAALISSVSPGWSEEDDHEATITVDEPQVRVQRLSWAGVRFEGPDRTLFVDPWMTPSIWLGAWTEPVIPIEATARRRTVLITHLHTDHFDVAGVKAALGDSDGAVICHVDQAHGIAARGFRPLPVQTFEPTNVGPFSVIPVPAVDGVNDRQVSWIIRIGDKRFIHCGDTVYHGGFFRVGRAFGPFAAAFLPINGAQALAVEPRPEVPMSMGPDDAVGAAALMGAKLVVPIHYGFHDPKNYLQFPDAEAKFIAAARARNLPFEMTKPGEWVAALGGAPAPIRPAND